MKRIYTMGTVQYTPGQSGVLIPLQQVSPYQNAPLVACHATQEGLASLTPESLNDRTRWGDREAKAYATAFVRQDEPDADVHTVDEWSAIQAQNPPSSPDDVLAAAAAIVESQG